MSGYEAEAAQLKRRLDRANKADKATEPAIEQLDGVIDDSLKRAKKDTEDEFYKSLYTLESYLGPIVITALAFFSRMYKAGINNHVVWDEAHFGKFGSYYLRHEFYHDVHPPLGKMLVGFSGYLAGYNGSWDFPSGEVYPDYIDYVKMRLFNAVFAALCVPVAYFTAKQIGFSLPTVYLFTILVLCENSYVTLGKLILLDSMLLFFTVTSVLCFVTFHNQRQNPFSRKWWKWLLLTGLSLGCTISVKMVGLFVITLVGIYTVVDLWNKFGDKTMKTTTYIYHWIARIVCLIIIPFLVFMFCFKIHFDLLSRSGTGDATMSSLFQANLAGSSIGKGPRDLAVGGSVFSMKNQGLGGGLLHSHYQTYPEGSKQQQITAYGHSDMNNDWFFDRVRDLNAYSPEETENEFVVDGGIYRLVHNNTGKNLHSHQVTAPVSATSFEVSGYGDAVIGDPKDYWVVEIVENLGNENSSLLHPLSTSFRLKHLELGCYLTQTGATLPEWGFRQKEIACVSGSFTRDKRTWWNIESHTNERLPVPGDDFKMPKTKFIKDFVALNLAMMATNNALVPDPEKDDQLASAAWEWPTLHVGIRLCGWGDENPKYFLMGTPASTWVSSVGVVVFALVVLYYLIRWQRQYVDFKDEEKLNLFLMGGIYPMFGWGLHFVPFVIMSRVTYVHHYLPALYFALLILSFEFEFFTRPLLKSKRGLTFRIAIYGIYYAMVIGCFLYFAPISYGMEGPSSAFKYLNWFSSWRIA